MQDSDESARDSNETKTEIKVTKPKVHFTTSVSENESLGSAAESINSESYVTVLFCNCRRINFSILQRLYNYDKQ